MTKYATRGDSVTCESTATVPIHYVITPIRMLLVLVFVLFAETVSETPKAHRSNILFLLQATEEHYGSIIPDSLNMTLMEALDHEGFQMFFNDSQNDEVIVDHHWDLWNSFFFTFITITTIGNYVLVTMPMTELVAPHTQKRIYALLSIEKNCLMLVPRIYQFKCKLVIARDRVYSD